MINFDYHWLRAELRQDVQRQLWAKGWNKTDLTNHTGIDGARISRIMKGKEHFSLNNLDAVTEALGLPQGHYYEYFIGECCVPHSDTLNPLKFLGFTRTCVEVGNYNHVLQEISKHLLELHVEPRELLGKIFELAEYAQRLGHEQDALIFYEQYVRLEEVHTERLAISYYRIFMAKRSGLNKAYYDALKLQEHVDRLPSTYVEKDHPAFNMYIDGYLRLMYFFNAIQNWDKLYEHSQRVYSIGRHLDRKEIYGEALLNIGYALVGVKQYTKALELIEQYEKLGSPYAELARKNSMYLHVIMGRLDVVEEYLRLLDDDTDYIIGLSAIIPAYVQAHELPKAVELLNRYSYLLEVDFTIVHPAFVSYYWDIFMAWAKYDFLSKDYTNGIDHVIQALLLSYQGEDVDKISECMLFYTRYNRYATLEQVERFERVVWMRGKRR